MHNTLIRIVYISFLETDTKKNLYGIYETAGVIASFMNYGMVLIIHFNLGLFSLVFMQSNLMFICSICLSTLNCQ